MLGTLSFKCRAKGSSKGWQMQVVNRVVRRANVTSARFIAQERALVEWSQLRLFKAKERRGYLQRIGLYKYSSFAAPHCLC